MRLSTVYRPIVHANGLSTGYPQLGARRHRGETRDRSDLQPPCRVTRRHAPSRDRSRVPARRSWWRRAARRRGPALVTTSERATRHATSPSGSSAKVSISAGRQDVGQPRRAEDDRHRRRGAMGRERSSPGPRHGAVHVEAVLEDEEALGVPGARPGSSLIVEARRTVQRPAGALDAVLPRGSGVRIKRTQTDRGRRAARARPGRLREHCLGLTRAGPTGGPRDATGKPIIACRGSTAMGRAAAVAGAGGAGVGRACTGLRPTGRLARRAADSGGAGHR